MIDFNIDNYLRISFSDVVLVLISTVLIVLFAKHFFWDKLLAYLKSRQDLIQKNIDQSEELKKQAMEEKAAYDEKMKNAGQDAHAILENAKAAAKAEKARILEDARSQAARMEQAAKEDIEREKRKAGQQMQNAISEAALAVAGALVGQEMDDTKRREFVEDFIAEAGESDQW